ncbi:MAG: polymer-forming cytoskeletal protein [Planctomycetota bacterium]
MPLKPALSAFRPRGPRPRELRHVACPNCSHQFTVSRKALTARCPTCTYPLAFEDVSLAGHHHGELSTMGHVELPPDAHFTGKLVCGSLHLAGHFNGSITAFGPVRIDPQHRPKLTGSLTAKSLHAPRGSAFRATVHVCPKPDPAKVAAALSATHRLRHTPPPISPAA